MFQEALASPVTDVSPIFAPRSGMIEVGQADVAAEILQVHGRMSAVEPFQGSCETGESESSGSREHPRGIIRRNSSRFLINNHLCTSRPSCQGCAGVCQLSLQHQLQQTLFFFFKPPPCTYSGGHGALLRTAGQSWVKVSVFYYFIDNTEFLGD